MLPELAERTYGIVIGERNYHSPKTKEELARTRASNCSRPTLPRREIPLPNGVPSSAASDTVSTPSFRRAHRTLLHKAGVVGQGSVALDRQAVLRKVLSHTVAFLLNHRAGNQPLQLAKLLHY